MRGSRSVATVAFLVLVGLVAFVTADGVEIPEPRERTAPDPCATPPPARSVGIAPGSRWKQDRRARADLQEMADLGVRWIRLGVEWAVVEPQRGQFRWDAIDRVIDEADSSCLSVLAMVGTTPQWAREPGCRSLWCPPRDLDQFGAFVRAVAERHPGQIAAWEVWNEPNHAAWFHPAPDPEHYGRLLEAATGALRAVDPDATVLSAGLAPSPSGNPARMLPARFLDRLYDTGALDAVDAIAYHPYSYPFLPSQRTGDNGFIDQLRSMREVVLDHDDDKKIWLTEFGSPTPAGDATSLVRQEQMVTDGFALWRSLDYVGPLFWFAWRDPEMGSPNPQANFGLRRFDDSAKPAFDDFEAEVRR